MKYLKEIDEVNIQTPEEKLMSYLRSIKSNNTINFEPLDILSDTDLIKQAYSVWLDEMDFQDQEGKMEEFKSLLANSGIIQMLECGRLKIYKTMKVQGDSVKLGNPAGIYWSLSKGVDIEVQEEGDWTVIIGETAPDQMDLVSTLVACSLENDSNIRMNNGGLISVTNVVLDDKPVEIDEITVKC